MKWYLHLLALSALLKYCVTNHCDKDRIDQIVQACAEVHGLPMDLDLLTILNDSNIVTKLCTNLDCFLECFKDSLSLCRFNATKSLKHDLVSYRTTFRYICSNSSEAVSIYQTCREDIQTRNRMCRNDLDLALRQAEADLTSTNDTGTYKNVVCQASSNYTFCMELSNSSTCPKQHVQKFNATVYALYSRAECGITSGLSHVYNYTGYCNPYTYPNGIIKAFSNMSNLCSVDSCTPYCVSYRISTGCISWTVSQPWTSMEILKLYCSNIDCLIDCMNEILENCSYNAPWLIQLDTTVELAYARHMCQNITFALEALNCSHDYRNHPCFAASTVSDYINAPIKYNNGDLQGFTTAVCRTYAYMKQYWNYEVSGSCTESQADYYNELVQISYSRPGCNDTSTLMQRYNMTTSCSSTETPKGNNSVNCTDYCSPACLTNRMMSSCLHPYNISYVDIFKFMNASAYLESYCGNLDCILDCLDSLLAECERSTNGPWLMQFDRIAYRSTARLVCDNATITAEASRNCNSALISGICWSSNSETAVLSAYGVRDEQGYVSAMCNRYNGLASCMNFSMYCAGDKSHFMNKVVNASYSLALCNVSSPVSAMFHLTASCSKGNSSRTSGSCNSTSARVTRCLTSYQLGSFPYGSNLTNLQQLCSNLDCTLDCLRNATEAVSYYCSVEYDNTTLITLYRFLCDNVSLTASTTNHCTSYFQALQLTCQPMLNDSLQIILSAFQNSSDEKLYVMETCSAKVNFTNCMKLPIDGSLSTCTVEEAKFYNDALNATNSFSVCGLSSPLVNLYDMNTYCGVVSSLPTTTLPSPTTDTNSIGSASTPITTNTITSPETTSTMAIPTTATYSTPSTTLTHVTIPSTTTTTTTTTTPTPLTTSTQVPRTFPTTEITSETTTSSHPITTTTTRTSITPGTIATSVQMPTASTTTNTTKITSPNPIATTKTTMTTTTTITQRTTTTTENIISCTSVNSDIVDCLTQYNLPSYNLTEYVNNAETICEKLECIMGCIKIAVGDCYKNNILYLTYDTVALITTYRYMCDNFNETLRAFKECASTMQASATSCLPSLLTAISEAESNYVTNKNKVNYLVTMCSGFSTYKTCVAISTIGNCTPTYATRINTVQRSWYSYYQCGVTSELYATYYQDPVCTQDDAEGIYGNSQIHICLLLCSLCLLYFFKY